MKKFLAGLVIGCVACSAQASYLYWQVDTGLENVQAWAAAQEMNWTTANLTISDGAGNNVTATLANLDINEDGYQGRTGVATVNLADLTGETTGWSYYIELANFSGSTKSAVLGTQSGTYADLSASITDNLDLENIPKASVWHGAEGGYRAAPEPTSAVLMMLGIAVLGLRRKRIIS